MGAAVGLFLEFLVPSPPLVSVPNMLLKAKLIFGAGAASSQASILRPPRVSWSAVRPIILFQKRSKEEK